MSISQKISDALYECKEKISDSEFMNLMNLVSELNSNESSEKQVVFELAIPKLDYSYKSSYNICEKEYELKFIMITIKTRLARCNKNKNLGLYDYCANCREINADHECYYLNVAKEYKPGSTVGFHILKNVCIDQYDYICHLKHMFDSIEILHPVHKYNCDHCEDSGEDYIEQQIKVQNKAICFNKQ